jgi:hypothetical protein
MARQRKIGVCIFGGVNEDFSRMGWLHILEAKFEHHAIHGLIRGVVALNALVFVLYKLDPGFLAWLLLDPALVLHGQVWRLVSYIFIPQFGDLIFPDFISVIFYLGFLWFIGEGLEHSMGAFRLNLFYLIGMIGTTVSAFFFGSAVSNVMLNASLFFAFARFHGDTMIYLFYILPVKIKWLAWIFAFFIMQNFLFGSMAARMAIVASLANYLVFFGADIWREARHRSSVASRRKRFEETAKPEQESLHHCKVCGKTEITDPYLDFRVARDGEEYCTAHLPKAVS